MHVATFALIVWAAFWAALPVKLVAIAGSAYIIIATLKKIFPAVSGWYALALNVVLSLCGVLMVATPGDFRDANFWARVMLTIASAAGIQGTVKHATGTRCANCGADPTQQTCAEKPRLVGNSSAAVLLLLFAFCFASSGCGVRAPTPPTAPATLPTGAVDKVDADANKALRPAHDFASSISNDVLSGKLKVSPAQRRILEELNRALNVADAAEKSYHNAGGADGGGTPAALNSAVSAALQAWGSAVAALPVVTAK